MGEMKKVLDEFFTFSDEEKERLGVTIDELLEFLKERKLTAKEALYVINRCEHTIFSSVTDKLI